MMSHVFKREIISRLNLNHFKIKYLLEGCVYESKCVFNNKKKKKILENVNQCYASF